MAINSSRPAMGHTGDFRQAVEAVRCTDCAQNASPQVLHAENLADVR